MTTRATTPGERSVQLDIKVMGREYKVACKESERADLLEAVAFLDTRMHEIRDGGKIAGADRIAVMAALNLANELLRERKSPPVPAPASASRAPASAADGTEVRRRIIAMQAAIDQTMAGQEKLL
ncbi:MAG: cell division protein ZapA [Betaproteobacteria bacterium]